MKYWQSNSNNSIQFSWFNFCLKSVLVNKKLNSREQVIPCNCKISDCKNALRQMLLQYSDIYQIPHSLKSNDQIWSDYYPLELSFNVIFPCFLRTLFLITLPIYFFPWLINWKPSVFRCILLLLRPELNETLSEK